MTNEVYIIKEVLDFLESTKKNYDFELICKWDNLYYFYYYARKMSLHLDQIEYHDLVQYVVDHIRNYPPHFHFHRYLDIIDVVNYCRSYRSLIKGMANLRNAHDDDKVLDDHLRAFLYLEKQRINEHLPSVINKEYQNIEKNIKKLIILPLYHVLADLEIKNIDLYFYYQEYYDQCSDTLKPFNHYLASHWPPMSNDNKYKNSVKKTKVVFHVCESVEDLLFSVIGEILPLFKMDGALLGTSMNNQSPMDKYILYRTHQTPWEKDGTFSIYLDTHKYRIYRIAENRFIYSCERVSSGSVDGYPEPSVQEYIDEISRYIPDWKPIKS